MEFSWRWIVIFWDVSTFLSLAQNCFINEILKPIRDKRSPLFPRLARRCLWVAAVQNRPCYQNMDWLSCHKTSIKWLFLLCDLVLSSIRSFRVKGGIWCNWYKTGINIFVSRWFQRVVPAVKYKAVQRFGTQSWFALNFHICRLQNGWHSGISTEIRNM
jgi:hypothetical protein